ncbi:MAG: hypothetical protein ACFFD7_17095 [Candidatus Thorarchaeota archaeon]
MEKSNVVIENSRLLLFLRILILLLFILVFCVTVFFYYALDFPSPALFLFLPWIMIFSITGFIMSKKRFRIVKFSLSPDKVSLSFHNRVYFESELELINEIIIIKNSIKRSFSGYFSTSTSEVLSIQFIGKNFEKTIGLWCCGFNYRKQRMIADLLASNGKELNKTVRIYENRSLVLNELENPCWEIGDFLKNKGDRVDKLRTTKRIRGIIGLLLLIVGGFMVIFFFVNPKFCWDPTVACIMPLIIQVLGIGISCIGLFLLENYFKTRRKQKDKNDWSAF